MNPDIQKRAEELAETDREFARQWHAHDQLHELRTSTDGRTWFWHDMPSFLIRLEETHRGDTRRFDRECDAWDALATELKRIKESLGFASALAAAEAAGIPADHAVGDLEVVVERPEQRFIVATDNGILHRMRQLAPGKTLIEAPTAGNSATCKSCAHCPWMAMNALQGVLACLEQGHGEIHVDEPIRAKAQTCIERMLAFTAAQGQAEQAQGLVFGVGQRGGHAQGGRLVVAGLQSAHVCRRRGVHRMHAIEVEAGVMAGAEMAVQERPQCQQADHDQRREVGVQQRRREDGAGGLAGTAQQQHPRRIPGDAQRDDVVQRQRDEGDREDHPRRGLPQPQRSPDREQREADEDVRGK